MHQQLQKIEDSESRNAARSFTPPFKVLLVHVACGIGLASSFWVAISFCSLIFFQDSARTLLIIWAIEAPVVIFIYSLFRINPEQCSYAKAIARGLLSLPAGAFVNALVAVVLGAPVGIQQFTKTLHWSLLMSSFTFVPAASVYGSSWADWHRLFAQSKPTGSTDFMVCLPAHGAVIGAWFGAWPMPLDWERPWQEWPICVSYGAIVGYFVGMISSFVLSVSHARQKHQKNE